MSGKKNGPQVGQYDKILKENLEETLPVIIKDILKLAIFHTEELPDDIQHTKERKPDVLKKVIDVHGESYVLHIEFQLKDEKEMVYRMAEYSVMLMRKYGLPIKQYVIFLMDMLPLMATAFNHEHHQYDFTLIRLAEVDYKIFLQSKNPSVQNLGILANFGLDDHYTAVETIISGINTNSKSDFENHRNINQLRMFAQLRKYINSHYLKATNMISNFFNPKKDPYYGLGKEHGLEEGRKKGLKEGRKEASHAVVKKLIDSDASDKYAALIADVSIKYVQQVRAELNHK